MPQPYRTIRHFAACALIALSASAAHAGDQSSRDARTAWDGAVNSLLATGMYGFDSENAPGLSVRLQHSDSLYRGLTPEKPQLSGQAITFSYEGSSGLLEFSGGYILSNQRNKEDPGTIFLGVDPGSDTTFDPGRSWYLAFDLSRSYQIDDNISFNLGNKAMVLQNPFDTEEGQIFSMLFNMPISYKNYLTITPEFQWSRPLSRPNSLTDPRISGDIEEKSSQDVFYGGVSVSFSY